jgi:hypothetical protein
LQVRGTKDTLAIFALSVTVTPFTPAGEDRFTGYVRVSPIPTMKLAGSTREPGVATVTDAVAPDTVGTFVDAVMVVDPTASAVT